MCSRQNGHGGIILDPSEFSKFVSSSECKYFSSVNDCKPQPFGPLSVQAALKKKTTVRP